MDTDDKIREFRELHGKKIDLRKLARFADKKSVFIGVHPWLIHMRFHLKQILRTQS